MSKWEGKWESEWWSQHLQPATKTIEMLDMVRHENLVCPGTPDTSATREGISFWCELKDTIDPGPTRQLLFSMEKTQPPWIFRRLRAGCMVWVAVRVRAITEHRRYLVPGYHALELKKGVREARLAAISVVSPHITDRDLILRMSGPWPQRCG